MKFFVVLVSLAAVVLAQDEGVEFGGLCNGLLLQCNRHNNTVVCMHRDPTNTCDTGLGVDLGRCQCARNCGSDGFYAEHGEFVPSKDVCGGFVGETCSGLVPHCVDHATCNLLTSKCVCQIGYVPDPTDTRRCIAG